MQIFFVIISIRADDSRYTCCVPSHRVVAIIIYIFTAEYHINVTGNITKYILVK